MLSANISYNVRYFWDLKKFLLIIIKDIIRVSPCNVMAKMQDCNF